MYHRGGSRTHRASSRRFPSALAASHRIASHSRSSAHGLRPVGVAFDTVAQACPARPAGPQQGRRERSRRELAASGVEGQSRGASLHAKARWPPGVPCSTGVSPVVPVAQASRLWFLVPRRLPSRLSSRPRPFCGSRKRASRAGICFEQQGRGSDLPSPRASSLKPPASRIVKHLLAPFRSQPSNLNYIRFSFAYQDFSPSPPYGFDPTKVICGGAPPFAF